MGYMPIGERNCKVRSGIKTRERHDGPARAFERPAQAMPADQRNAGRHAQPQTRGGMAAASVRFRVAAVAKPELDAVVAPRFPKRCGTVASVLRLEKVEIAALGRGGDVFVIQSRISAQGLVA